MANFRVAPLISLDAILPQQEHARPLVPSLPTPDHVDSETPNALDSNPRYIVHSAWSSPRLESPRDLFIYLPEAYFSETSRSFPVLLLHDGQNLFDGRLSYLSGSTWRAGETADALTARNAMQPVILVGIANTGITRLMEYTPDADPVMGGGKGPIYIRALVEDLLPFLRSQYRILPSRRNTAIAGSSLGGLISLYAAFAHPQTFGGVGALSPSLWWNRKSFLNFFESLPQDEARHSYPNDTRVWLDMGTLEGEQHVNNALALSRALQQRGWIPGKDLIFRRIRNAGHTESAWAARFGDVLRFLFPPA